HTQQLTQTGNDALGCMAIGANERVDRIERIEEKMGVQLQSQALQLRASEPGFELLTLFRSAREARRETLLPVRRVCRDRAGDCEEQKLGALVEERHARVLTRGH